MKADGGSATEPEVTGEAEIHPKLTDNSKGKSCECIQ